MFAAAEHRAVLADDRSRVRRETGDAPHLRVVLLKDQRVVALHGRVAAPPMLR